MNAQVKIDTPDSEAVDVAIVADVTENPALVFTDGEKFDEFFKAVEAETDTLIPDVTTEKGRKAIASMAYKVAQSKTAIDDAGKGLNADAQASIKKINAARNLYKEKLEALRDKVREPLNKWDNEQKAIQAENEIVMSRLRAFALVAHDATSKSVSDDIERLAEIEIGEERFGDDYALAIGLHESATQILCAALERLLKEEAGRAELQQLRKANEARAKKDAEAEQQRLAEERRVEAEKRKAEEEKAREAEMKRREEAAAEQARIDESNRLAKIEEERAAKARHEAEEANRRAADADHREAVIKAAVEALMRTGHLDDIQALAIITAIESGSIPNIQINF